MIAGRIVAKAAGAADWNALLQKELLDPLGMSETSYTAAAMRSSSNHATGYRWTPRGTIEVPFTQIFPYDFFSAGDINSNIEEMARWVRLELAKGLFEGRRLMSEANLELTHQSRSRDKQQSFLCIGMGRSSDRKWQHCLAQRRNEQFRRLCRFRPGKKCRRHRPHQRGKRGLSGCGRLVDARVRTATYLPAGQFAAIAEALGPSPAEFVQPQMDKDGRSNMLRLTFSDGQSYDFTRDPEP